VTEITDILRDELERLARELEPRGVPLIIGGGYGLLLSQERVRQSGVPTVREIPEARSTNDLDLFLSVEIVTDADKMGALRDVLRSSGYTASPGAEHYQFRRDVLHRGAQRNIKVDLLAPPPRDLELLEKVRVDARRLRNRMVRESTPTQRPRRSPSVRRSWRWSWAKLRPFTYRSPTPTPSCS
jgi:hypothetical protein